MIATYLSENKTAVLSPFAPRKATLFVDGS